MRCWLRCGWILVLLGASAPIAVFGQVQILGGSLSGGAMTFAPFAGVALGGTQQTTTASWQIASIIDSRGTGAGWNESLTLTQLRQYDTTLGLYVLLTGHALPTSSIAVTTPSSVTASSGSSSISTIAVVPAGTALDTGSAVKLVSAAVNGGMGTYSFGAMVVTLSVPASAFGGTYKTDATVALTSGP